MATPRAPGQPGSPDPSLAGPIRNIVKDAHKWGGNGVEPDFTKIKRVLTTKHPDVIAKAFGGNADQAAAWIKDNWAFVHGKLYACKDGSRKHTCWRNPDGDSKKLTDDQATPEAVGLSQAVEDLITQDGVTHELFFASDDDNAEEDEGLIWKDILLTGTWKIHPNAVRRARGEKFRITKADLEEIVENFEEGAWEHVTVPKTHDDRVDENTGLVKKLVIRPAKGLPGRQHKLRAGIKFADQDIYEKVLDGRIANVSCGLDFGGVQRTRDGRIFQKVLKHVALTNQPWIKGLTPFGNHEDMVAASEGDEEWNASMVLDNETETREGSEVAKTFMDRVKELITGRVKNEDEVVAALDGLTVPEGLTTEEAEEYLSELATLVGEGEPDGSDGATTSKDSEDDDADGGDDPDDGDNPTTETEGGDIDMSEKETKKSDDDDAGKIALSQDELQAAIDKAVADARKEDQVKLSALQQENHERRVNEQIREREEQGYTPAVLTVVKEIKLADVERAEIITLSEDDGDVKLSASDIVDRILDAFPEESLVKFSESKAKERFEKATSKSEKHTSDDIDAELDALRS